MSKPKSVAKAIKYIDRLESTADLKKVETALKERMQDILVSELRLEGAAEFTGRRGIRMQGVIKKINVKTCLLHCTDGRRWTVALPLISVVTDPAKAKDIRKRVAKADPFAKKFR